MTAPNSNYGDLATLTLEFRSPDIADNVLTHSPLFAWLKKLGAYKPASGTKIVERLAYAENTNAGWYTGNDSLPTAGQEEFSGAEFNWKQLAVPVVINGLEADVQNTGKEAIDDLLEERVANAEKTAKNKMGAVLFTDGTGTSGKELTGLTAMCPTTVTTGTYGSINRANFSFWRPKYTDSAANPSASTIQGLFNTFWYPLNRDGDKPDIIVCDDDVMGAYEASLQTNQRFTDPEMAKLGFESLKYKSAVIVYDSNCTDKTAYFLNSSYLRLRYAAKRNFKPLPKRTAFNQDAEAVILTWAGNLTCCNQSLQGRHEFTA